MTKKTIELPIWQITNAWHEILARIFDDLAVNLNVWPEWLINPVTNRRLKLDLLYPQLGVAVRFEGLQGKQRRQRPDLEEEAQQKIRDNARVEMCRAYGIELIVVNLTEDSPKHTFRAIDICLSRAKERVTDEVLLQKIGQARATAADLARRINYPGGLKLYAELWEDRQYQFPKPTRTPAPVETLPAFTIGMEVEHTTFGPGVITAITGRDADTILTVNFVTTGQKTLMVSLLADKLRPRHGLN